MSKNQDRKDAMWIACCGCNKPINIPETTKLIGSTPLLIMWKSACPYCGFTHKLILTKWVDKELEEQQEKLWKIAKGET